eukprot:CAMPEP_0115853892 /NCGR_PEP_ID=MMETSP0287-20121206/13737_1 /TAXON_ID=412157 /ORGANISM="Chrysochromulina rotalis, Strain UIO044" /LENGTH=319 /DNA_ID=CAMNT_0003307981 /DNA_START=24 /DNA_END=983 /DNA_ORIENTATION=-
MGDGCKFGVVRRALSFGAYVTADLFLPDQALVMKRAGKAAEPLPVVLLLPGHSYHTGVTGAYTLMKSDTQGGLIHAMAARGVAVLVWDTTGMGMRQHVDGAPRFYRRHPEGSRLGVMVGEVLAALDFVHCASVYAGAECSDGEAHTSTYPALELPLLDPNRVYALGYSLGSIVALHAAALAAEERPVAGVAAFAGWTPWRTGAGGEATGGLRLLYETFALLPRLGYFDSDPGAVPYDYDELIASLAPRPMLLYAPQGNRFANATDVQSSIEEARSAWSAKGAAAAFEAHTPEDAPSDMKSIEISVALEWIERVVLGLAQ